MHYPIVPVPKPRMTRRDVWAKRPCVLRYRAFKDAVRDHRVILPECGGSITFYLAMPKYWSKKKKETMNGQGHQQVPDLDNLLKALSDAVHLDDSKIWMFRRVQKLWSYKPGITIEVE